MMTTPATAIKNEIRQRINLHVEVFGRPLPLTPFELEECQRRSERIRLLGQELDRISLLTNTDERFREAS